MRRLVSIVNSGARCGVYALIMLDTKMQLPSGFQLKDIENNCVNILWKDNKLNWREPNLGRYPLALDAPPDPGLFSKILHRVGAAARDANRVEVPVRVHRAEARPVLDLQLEQDGRHPAGPRRRHQAPAPRSWARGPRSTC